MVERRDDVGGKVLTGVMGGVIMLFLGLFVNTAWSTANEGKNKAFEIGERVTVIEAKFGSIQSDLGEIKDILRRKIP